MRLYLLRHPAGLLIVAALAIADVAWHTFVAEPARNFIVKGTRK